VVFVIVVLMAIAIPNYLKAKRSSDIGRSMDHHVLKIEALNEKTQEIRVSDAAPGAAYHSCADTVSSSEKFAVYQAIGVGRTFLAAYSPSGRGSVFDDIDPVPTTSDAKPANTAVRR
jgi:hypothetical protein